MPLPRLYKLKCKAKLGENNSTNMYKMDLNAIERTVYIEPILFTGIITPFCCKRFVC